MSRAIRTAAARAVAVPILLSLAACQAAPALVAVGGAVAAASQAYCNTLTEAGRQSLRDRLTGGRPVIACFLEGR